MSVVWRCRPTGISAPDQLTTNPADPAPGFSFWPHRPFTSRPAHFALPPFFLETHGAGCGELGDVVRSTRQGLGGVGKFAG